MLDVLAMRTLLLVDDYDGVLFTLKWLLSNRGYRILTARSGQVALALAHTEIIHAAVIDMQMPEMDGFETCQALRAQAGSASFPVWMMTGAYCTEAVQRAREIGAVALLNKPFDTDALIRDMETYWAAPPTSPASDSESSAAT